jgi:hypothetical protein
VITRSDPPPVRVVDNVPAVDIGLLLAYLKLMRPQPLVVHLRLPEDAECVAQALAVYPVSVEGSGDAWDVHVGISSGSLGDVLTALHECLLENEIRQVRVTVDGKTYAMEAAAV